MKKLYQSPVALIAMIDDADVLTASVIFSSNTSDDVKDIYNFGTSFEF